MFLYQQKNQYFAQVAPGLEPLAADELKQIGAQNIKPVYSGIFFGSGPDALYSANYHSRLITRVLAPLAGFDCRDRDDLYRVGKSIPWHTLFSSRRTFSVTANVSANRQLTHSKFAALCLKDAIADAFRQRYGRRPDVDPRDPDIRFHLHLAGTRATISLDTSGDALHRRGYRKASVTAPMQETLAAAIIRMSDWKGDLPVYDPMCGSGTFLCEAAMRFCRIPPGYFRARFGFQHLTDFDRHRWQQIKRQADERMRPLPESWIAGSDKDRRAVQAAIRNCAVLPGGERIGICESDFRNIANLENTVIFCNPPYGIRSPADRDIAKFYGDFGDFLKQRCKGSQAYIYFGNRDLIKAVGLKPRWKKPLRNAGLDGRIVKYELY